MPPPPPVVDLQGPTGPINLNVGSMALVSNNQAGTAINIYDLLTNNPSNSAFDAATKYTVNSNGGSDPNGTPATLLQKYNQVKTLLDYKGIGSTSGDSERIQIAMNSFLGNVKTYIKQGGINPTTSDSASSEYTTAKLSFEYIMKYIQCYELLTQRLSELLNSTLSSQSSATNSNNIATLQTTVTNLTNDIKSQQVDLDIAQSRQQSVTNLDGNVSYYQGFAANLGFVRPFKQFTIPILLAFGILSLFLSAIVLREYFQGTSLSEAVNELKTSLMPGESYFASSSNGESIVSSIKPYGVAIGASIAIAGIVGLTMYGILGKSQ